MPHIRRATPQDLGAIHRIEALSFPKSEAATIAQLEERLSFFASHHWVLEEDMAKAAGIILGFIGGMVSSRDRIADIQFERADLHEPGAAWQTVFGLAVHPEFRNRGYAAKLIRRLLTDARAAGQRGVTLTCKDHLTSYYKKFGFIDMGTSGSTHGGAVWHDMLLHF